MIGLGLGYLSMKFHQFSLVGLDITSLTNVIVEKNVVFCYVFAHLLGPYGSDWAETHRRGRLGWCLPDMFYQLCRQSHLEPTFGRRLIFPTKKIFLSPNFFFFFFFFFKIEG